jgi:hypothetical protein
LIYEIVVGLCFVVGYALGGGGGGGGGGLTLPTVGRFSFYKRKSSELWLGHNLEPLENVYINN